MLQRIDLAPALTWKQALRLVLAVLAGLLVMRLAALAVNGTDLFFDEAQYWSWSTEPSFGYYSKPPLIAWLIALSTGVCGASEFCVRLPSPLLHFATSLVVFAIGVRYYSPAVGAWAAVAYATLPGVSLSAGIISTDVPLLLCWAVAMAAFMEIAAGNRQWWPALVLGAALGAGLNAKYATAYFVLCAVLYIALTPEARRLARDARLWVGLAIAAALIAPNLIWNAANSFATFSHTADNAKWSGSLGNPVKAIEFFLAQFGVFGPILFASLLVISWRAWRKGIEGMDRLLLAFAVPVVLIVTVQAFISRAHANWAAVSYVAASVLVIATMVREGAWRWLAGSVGLHAALMLGLIAATSNATAFRLPGGANPFARTLGWAETATAVREEIARARAAGEPYASLLTDDRALTASLLYYLRDEPTPQLAWREAGGPRDHFELTRPFQAASPQPALLIAQRPEPASILSRFASVRRVGDREVARNAGKPRRVTFYRLEGYLGR